MTEWTGRCVSRGMALMGVGIGLLAVALGLGTIVALRGTGAQAWIGLTGVLIGIVVAIAVVWTSRLQVRITDERFVVGFGPTHWPRRTIELADVVDASAILIEPLQWGGWGYRWIPWKTSSAAVVRRGPGILLALRDGRRFAVTVDDAVAGAKAASDALAPR